MPGGRPPGSRNQKGHGAGGARPNAGRKSREAHAEGAARALERFEARRATNAAAAGPAAAAEEEKKRREVEFRKKTLKELQKSAHDQQIYDEEYCDARDVYPDLVEIDDDGAGDDEEEIEDYETDDEGEGETKKRRNRARSAYMPPPHSPLQLLLKKTHDKQKTSSSSLQQLNENGKMWVPPEVDPLAIKVTGPDRYCSSDTWQFIWRPFKQFGKHVQLSNLGCIHGCERGDLENMLKLKEMRWRPMFWNDTIVWLLYDRIECKVCKRCTSTIDPRFLKLMPTIVVERLPFITTASGPGIHRSMLYLLNNLRTKQVTEGVFAGAVNEANRIRYDHNRVAYYDRVAETFAVDSLGLYGQSNSFGPFPSFNSPGKFNGIRLTEKVLKAALNSYMLAYEPYMQACFQLQSDEGLQTDHTHKYENGVRASGRPGKIFTCGYTGASLAGNCVFSPMAYTKSTYELNLFMGLYAKSRDNAGIGNLKIHSSDNINGDGALVKNHFKEDLERGVVPYRPPNQNCLQVTISSDE